MEKNNRIQLPLEEIKLAFAASCVEGAARKLGVPYIEIYERMRKVDLINKFILPHYDTLHTESREYLIEDVIECLTNWEKKKLMKVTVYHGATEIIEAPLYHVGRPRLDFGQGFYVTDLKEQAIKWAKTIADKRAAEPLLNIYSLDRDAILAEARCKIFTAYDKDWLDFIVANRRGKNLAKDYDYVEGGIANDRVIDTVNLYMTGFYDTESALQQLTFHKPNNQICLLNQDLINKYLIYNGTEKI